MKRQTKIFLLSCIAFVIFIANQGFAQNQRRIIQLSGVILSQDSVHTLPGTHIYVPLAGRGTTSNNTGFFSLPVLPGDSVIISAVGFKRRNYTVPATTPEFTTLVVVMSEDTTLLPTVEITPYPTIEVFKEAILALNIPLDENGIDKSQLNSELMALMIRTTPMDANANYKYYMSQYPQSIQNKFMPVTNPFLDVFNWAKFFKQLKQAKKDKEAQNKKDRIPD